MRGWMSIQIGAEVYVQLKPRRAKKRGGRRDAWALASFRFYEIVKTFRDSLVCLGYAYIRTKWCAGMRAYVRLATLKFTMSHGQSFQNIAPRNFKYNDTVAANDLANAQNHSGKWVPRTITAQVRQLNLLFCVSYPCSQAFYDSSTFCPHFLTTFRYFSEKRQEEKQNDEKCCFHHQSVLYFLLFWIFKFVLSYFGCQTNVN